MVYAKLFCIVLASIPFLLGCNSGPPALDAPSLDPAVAAGEAIRLYDKDGDRKLDTSELEACPGLAFAIKVYDTDGDGMISEDEITSRLSSFVDVNVALNRLSAKVLLDGRPLGDAEVRFIPEPYLGEEIKPAFGKTRKGGNASMAVAVEDLPENQKKIRGIHTATFRVEITHPEKDIPARYNTETTLGYETTPGNPYAVFKIKSR